MTQGNVLVIGNSGVGKSTLINAVLGRGVAATGWGTSGTTTKLEIYESDAVPFRIIDTVGFEPSFFKAQKAINAVVKWSKDTAKEDFEDRQINAIWFCVEGTSRKLFSDAIKNLSKATKMWTSVPVIVVITKSYSAPERSENIEMVNNAFADQKRYSNNLRKVIPVVAATFSLNETSFAAPEGIIELIDATNEVMPEGLKAGEQDLLAFKLKRKQVIAQSIVGVSTAAGAVVGATPVPFADAFILAPIEMAEINALARLYGIDKEEGSNRLLKSMVEAGTVSAAAKAAISALKAIPGINIATSAMNAVVAGSVVVAIGQASIHVFEKIYLGEKDISDIEWVKRSIESALSSGFIEKSTEVLNEVSEKGNMKDFSKVISDQLMAAFGHSSEITATKK